MRRAGELLGRLQDVKHDTEIALASLIRDDAELKEFEHNGENWSLDMGIHPITQNRGLIVKRNGVLIGASTELLLNILEHLEEVKELK